MGRKHRLENENKSGKESDTHRNIMGYSGKYCGNIYRGCYGNRKFIVR